MRPLRCLVIEGAGRGVIAGKGFVKDDVFDDAVSLVIASSACSMWQVNNYVYASDNDLYSMLIFGPASLFNHNNDASVKNSYFLWSDYTVTPVEAQVEAHTTYTGVTYYADRAIQAGTEIFTTCQFLHLFVLCI
jgi:hypothetical protein